MTSKALLNELHGGAIEATIELLMEAISYTVPDFKTNKIKDYYLSNSELNIIIDVVQRMISAEMTERAKEILYNSDVNNSNYKKLNNIYFERTGFNVIEEKNKSSMKNISEGNFKQDFFNSLFNQQEFLNVFDEFLIALNKTEITIEDIRSIEYDFFANNEKLECMEEFLKHFQSKDNIITKENLLSMDWNFFQISYIQYMLSHNDELIADNNQKQYIFELCLLMLKKVSFKNSIIYKENGKSFTTNKVNIYIWYLRFRFDFIFPEDILIDMLDFDWTMNDYKEVGIDYIKQNVSKDKISKRIVSNIKDKTMYDKVLNNHINYCIENNLFGLSEYLEKYLLNPDLQPFEKSTTIDYLLLDLGAELFIDKYLDIVNYDTQLLCLEKIFNINKRALVSYLNNKIVSTIEENKILEYARYLISCNGMLGLKAYYKIVSEKMRNPDKSFNNYITTALSKVNNIQMLDIICDLFLLTFNKKFKDSKFESIYNGCKNAFINIGLYEDNYEKTINKLNAIIKNNSRVFNIGFTYYIIDELTLKHYQNNQNTKDISRIIEEINSIVSKKPEATGIIINL
jgi:hypothetical protein